ncbi:hypothetical protein ACYOEI_09640 [Singulisphaera rosea]
MHDRTRATIDRLKHAEWFADVGRVVDGPFVLVQSWDAAIASCSSQEWENLQLEASNQFAEHVSRKAPDLFRKWNKIVEELKTVIVPLVQMKIDCVVQAERLPKMFEDAVQWDILGVCIEAEYADVQPPGFFASQAFWYVNGRFPCGWDGCFPAGKLILF